MTDIPERPGGDLAYAEQMRWRTRVARDGSWFALVIFGVIVLLAMVFYRYPGLSASSLGCHGSANSFTCTSVSVSRGVFGSGLGSPTSPPIDHVSPWATTYWVVSIFGGIAAVVGFYWMRVRSSGVAGRIWPFAAVGLGVLVLAVVSRGWITFKIPADFWIRGMQPLLVIAIGLLALAVTERSPAFFIFVVGFLGLALLSCLYDVSNLFARLGLGSAWNGSNEALPNLILPGLYLLVGGAAFYLVRRSGVTLHIARRRFNDGQ
ncbi:MAG: hypothetical protein WA786_10660 [Acidimicrobiales bacterium]